MIAEELPDVTDFNPFEKLSKDLRAAAKLLGKREARFLVDFYYTIQDNRIRSDAQVRSSEEGEPNKLIDWCASNFASFENNIKSALGIFTMEYTVGQWARSICGVGPVITAGLLTYLDIRRAETYGGFWRLAGLDPTQTWEKKTKRPWNAALKSLCCYKLGESFVKVQNNDSDYYGQLFVRRKERETQMNMDGRFADQARGQLGDDDAKARCMERSYPVKARAFGDDTASRVWLEGRISKKQAQDYLMLDASKKLAYVKKQGENAIDSGVRMLPPAQIHARARRYAVKMFLAHLHHVMYVDFHGRKPMCAYPFEKLNHDKEHYLPPPNWPMDETAKSLKEMME